MQFLSSDLRWLVLEPSIGFALFLHRTPLEKLQHSSFRVRQRNELATIIPPTIIVPI